MLDFVMAAGFEDVHEANDIGIDVGMRIFKAVANAGLGGKIDYPIKSVFGKDLFDGSAIAQVSLNEGKALMIAENGEAIVFQLHLVVIVEIIKTHDLVATLEKVNGEMKADKPRCARNQNLHRLLLLFELFNHGCVDQPVACYMITLFYHVIKPDVQEKTDRFSSVKIIFFVACRQSIAADKLLEVKISP